MGSITHLVPYLRNRDEFAIEQLWARYINRIHSAARPVIAGLAPGAGDEEDVAQSAFHAFCRAAAADRLPPIANRNELWRLLLTFTRRTAIDHVRHEYRFRRGGSESFAGGDEAARQARDRAASVLQVVELQETLDELLAKLAATGDARLAEVARLRLEGYDNQEIADKLRCAVRTVQRKLRILEVLWGNYE